MPGGQNVSVSIPINRFVMRGCRTYFVYYVDKDLGVIHTEATNHGIRVRTRKDSLHKKRKFVRRKHAPDQTLAGWSVEVERINRGGGAISITQKTCENGAVDVPLTATDVEAVSSEVPNDTGVGLSITLRFPKSELCGLRTPSIS